MTPHRFHFFRAGGVDQVSLRDGDDLLALPELDHKLWVALAMPSKGLDLDAATLAILDRDGDGRIRVNDIVDAITFIKTTFANPTDVLNSRADVALSAIADAKTVAAAKRMLADLGKPTATTISIDDSVAIEKAFAATVLNGDGIVIAESTDDAALRGVIEQAIACVGSVVDRSGKPGVDKALADAFFAAIDERAAWLAKRAELSLPGVDLDVAAAAHAAVRAKLDDYVTRCRIAAFDPRGTSALAAHDDELVALAARELTADDDRLAALPLAAIDPSGELVLDRAINPAWRARLDAFVTACVVPILGPRARLVPADLATIDHKLAPFLAWRAAEPSTKVDALPPERVRELAAVEPRAKLAELIARDAALADEYAQIGAVGKCVRVQRDFGRVLRNFVSFSDFYSKQDGVFQTGTLYLDARALHLCIAVGDAGRHGTLAGASEMSLVYCDVTRGAEKKQIVAAVTAGDEDNLFVGRNGVFYDRSGNDWDATVVKLVPNPISVRAAFWSPYKKLVKTIETGLSKRAQAAEAQSMASVEAAGSAVAEVDKREVERASTPAKPNAPGRIDLGTIAAIGVAIGGIGTLVGALLAVLFGLGVWLPVGVIALIMMISGPSMLLAWLKLRRRNLGPILDANGWAINGRARINVAFGEALTELAKLPKGATRSLDDPFADKRTPWRRWVVLFIVLGLAGSWYLGKLDDYLPDSMTSIGVLGDVAPAYKKLHPPAPAPAPAPAPPKK